jgi:DNA segregation ATPase FtsK/SpoIIIE, S-DNA-T family
VGLRELLLSPELQDHTSREILIPLGLDVDGKVVATTLRDSPHMLIGGSTGSGKSVFLLSALATLMLNNAPETLRLVLIDPKRGLSLFRDSPFLHQPIINEPEAAVGVLEELVGEMERRYEHMDESHMVNDIALYNKYEKTHPLFRIVVVLEEYADLTSDKDLKKEIESAVQRLAQKARGAGIHLFVVTQNPLGDVVSSVIKSNLPGRAAFKVSQMVNSQVILDEPGAERLLKNGDMLFKNEGDPQRVQAAYLSDEELRALLQHFRSKYSATNTP